MADTALDRVGKMGGGFLVAQVGQGVIRSVNQFRLGVHVLWGVVGHDDSVLPRDCKFSPRVKAHMCKCVVWCVDVIRVAVVSFGCVIWLCSAVHVLS